MVYPSESNLRFFYTSRKKIIKWCKLLTRVIGPGVGGRGTLAVVSGTWIFLEIKNFEHVYKNEN